jgi:hypothetical protein
MADGLVVLSGGVDLGCLCFAHFQTAGTDNTLSGLHALDARGKDVPILPVVEGLLIAVP